jgi:predicted permease
MGTQTQIVFFSLVALVSALFGYTARRRGWIGTERAGGFMKAAVVGFDTSLGLFAVWRLHIIPGTWQLPLVNLGMIATMLGVGFLVARLLGLGRLQKPSFAFGASISNISYTLGGFVALSLLGPDALGYQFVYLLSSPFFIFLVMFPLAHHYTSALTLTPLELVRRSLLDVRSLPLYAVSAGLALSLLGVPYPTETLERVHLVDVLLVVGIVLSYIGIGLTISLRAMRPYLLQSIVMCVLKFAVTPLLMLGIMSAIGYTGIGRQLCLLLSLMPCAVYSIMIPTLFRTDRDLAMTNFLVSHAVFFAVILPFVLPWAIGL